MAKLRPITQKWVKDIRDSFELESHHEKILNIAATSWELYEDSRERIAADGAVILDRFKQLKSHPSVKIMQDSQIIFMRAMRELGLDVEAPGEIGRPPAIQGRR